LALSVPLRGSRRSSPVAQFLVVRQRGDATDMTKLKIGIIAGTLALVAEGVIYGVISRFGYDGLGSHICLVLIYPAVMFGSAVGLLTDMLAHEGGTEVILTPVFVFVWFFLIVWVIFSKMYGRRSA
jgi:hypothetical protein